MSEGGDRRIDGAGCTFIFEEQSTSEEERAKTNSKDTTSFVFPSKRKSKFKPNILRPIMLDKIQENQAKTDSSGSGSDEVMASQKPKRSAMPEGPQDQGTATLACLEEYKETEDRTGASNEGINDEDEADTD